MSKGLAIKIINANHRQKITLERGGALVIFPFPFFFNF
jgi:hypothetical protein